MKSAQAGTRKKTIGLSIFVATILFGAAVAEADVVLDWNKIAVDTAVANKQNAFAQARYAAIVQLAVFEAVNAITGDYQPYLGTITAPAGASADAAAIEAAYQVLINYFPASASTTLNSSYLNSMAQIPDGQAKIDGIATGDAAAQAMIALRANDGSSPPAIQGSWSAGSRRMAGNSELSNCEWSRGWNRVSMAEHNSIRHPRC
jgi:hypothetical protein